jgi:tetratricopeptide (TPR) repeat protein
MPGSRRFRFFVFAAAALLFAATASAQTALEQRCMQADGQDAIVACSDIIGAGSDREASWAYFDRGRAYFHAKLYGSAISDFIDFLRYNPDNAGAFTLRGRAFLAMGDYDHAVNDFDSAADLQPGSADALREACWARAAGDHGLDTAVDDCTKALALKPGDPVILEARCFAQYRNAAYSTAVADCAAALRADPFDASALYLRGLAKKQAGLPGSDGDLAAAATLNADIAATFEGWGVKP